MEGERWTAAQVHQMAPDASGLKAGIKLAAPGPWSGTGYSAADRLLWGECRGSGLAPYRVTVCVESVPAYQCSCPSRKFPCKHAIGLLLLWVGGAVAGGAELPDRVAEWDAARQARAEKAAVRAEQKAAGAVDQEAAARRFAQRRARVDAGLAELDRWLADTVAAGLAQADCVGYAEVDRVAKRLVDAQAPGPAARVRELPSVRASGDGWPDRLLAELARLHLLCRAWERLDDLPPSLRHTVSRRVGLAADAETVRREGEPVTDHWLVLGTRDRVVDPMTERRIWLRGKETGRDAVVLSFGAAGAAPAVALPAGAGYAAELTFYPEAAPLRVRLGDVAAAPGFRPAGGTLESAAHRYADMLAADPWLDGWPVVCADVVPAEPDGVRALCSAADGRAVPVRCHDSAWWQLLAVSGGHPVTVFGEYADRGLDPVTVWADDRAVPL